MYAHSISKIDNIFSKTLSSHTHEHLIISIAKLIKRNNTINVCGSKFMIRKSCVCTKTQVY